MFVVSADYVQCLTQPMELKYDCPSQSTWKAAASAFLTVLRIGLPIARQQSKHFWLHYVPVFHYVVFDLRAIPQCCVISR